MSVTLSIYMSLASGLLATTYGWGEMMCGPYNSPRRCEDGALTASGVPLSSLLPQVAIAAPDDYHLPRGGIWIGLRLLPAGECRRIHLVDKMAGRWVGERGWDLTNGGIAALGGIPSAGWSGLVATCKLPRWSKKNPRDSRWETELPMSRIPREAELPTNREIL